MNQFGLLGFPLSHSFSVDYFTKKFEREGIKEAEYVDFPLSDIDIFPELIQTHPDLLGLNVTIPYKQAVMKFLNALDEEAAGIGAVNVIRVDRSNNGTPYLKGYNTDVIGFRESIRPLIKDLVERIQANKQINNGLKSLVLGTGGASKAICYALGQLNIDYLLVSRTAGGEGAISYGDLTPDLYDSHRIIVNTTPAGMSPDNAGCPLSDFSHIGSGHLLYDLIYNPLETVFLRKGREQGALVKNGIEMLHLQAEASWTIWTTR